MSVPPRDPAPAAVPNVPALPDPPRLRHEIADDAAAFAVAPDLIVTDALAVEGATLIRVQAAGGNPMDATVVRTDAASGLACCE